VSDGKPLSVTLSRSAPEAKEVVAFVIELVVLEFGEKSEPK